MPLCARIAGLLITAGSLGAVAADQPDTIEAVTPGGPGVLTKCRSWLVTTSCRTYRHISLPSRIAVGNTITISFGSHPKEFGFHVARIDLKGQHCAIFSKAEGDRHRMDKINVAPCYPADEGRPHHGQRTKREHVRVGSKIDDRLAVGQRPPSREPARSVPAARMKLTLSFRFARDSALEGDGFEPIGTLPNFLPPRSIPPKFAFCNKNRLPRDRDRWFESVSLQG
jgi:hypothetical protein